MTRIEYGRDADHNEYATWKCIDCDRELTVAAREGKFVRTRGAELFANCRYAK